MRSIPGEASPLLGAVFDEAPRALVATDIDGTVVLWNKAARRLYGWAEEDAVGVDILELLAPRPVSARTGGMLDEARSGGTCSGEVFVRGADGGCLRVQLTLWPVTDASGAVVGVVGEGEEVGAEQLLAGELRAGGDGAGLGLAGDRIGSWLWEPTVAAVTWDTSLEALHGLPTGGFGGTLEAWLDLVHSDDERQVRAALDDLGRSGAPCQVEYRTASHVLPERWLATVGRATYDRNGVPLGAVGFAGAVAGAGYRLPPGDALPLPATDFVLVSAEGAATHLAGLQALTATLARALDAAEVADAVFVHGLAQLGGHTASLCLLAPGGTVVDIVHEIGYPDAVKARWRSFPLDAPVPASEAIRGGELVLVQSKDELHRRYPIFAGTPLVGDDGLAVVPLPDDDGMPFGALVVGFREARCFDESDKRLLTSLGNLCAGALRRAHRYEAAKAAMEAEQAARRAAERSQARLAFMAEAASSLASSLDFEQTLSQVVGLAVPRLADWCAVHLVRGDGAIRPLATAHADPDRLAPLRRLLERYPPGPDDPTSIWAVVRSGQARSFPELTDEVLAASVKDPERRAMIEAVGLGSLAVFPLRAGGRVLGTLSLAAGKGAVLDQDSLSLAEELAVVAGVAIDNAVLFDERSRIARSLQASLLPVRLPDIPGIEVGARYLAAGEGVEVGGDLYDVFPAGRNRWAVVVGDVRGKGVDAAALTGLTRNTIRSEAIRGPAPSAILAHVNEVLRRADAGTLAESASELDRWERSEPRFCTVALAMVEPSPDGARVTLALAGHPQPLLVRGGGTTESVGVPGSLLGVGVDLDLRDVEIQLGRGDVLVLFTDGVVERHEGKRFFEEDGVTQVVRSTRRLGAAAIAAAIEDAARAFVAGSPPDDMAVLVVRVPEDA